MEQILTPGRMLAQRFRVDSFLGRGGMGEVWRCFDMEQRRDVAAKVVRLEITETPWLFHLFYNEVVAMARLDHPAIVPIYDFLVEPDLGFFFVMEFNSASQPLRDLMQRPQPWWLLRSFIEELLDGVAYAHSKGTLHLDLKPENILVRREGERLRPTILDFGISRMRQAGRGIESWAEDRNVVGTLHYMAPEQLSGDLSRFGRWTDLYEVGILLYEIISGRLPFPYRPADAAYQRLSNPAPPLVPRPGCDAPEPFLRVVDWMLARHPHHRPRFAADIQMVLSTLPKPIRRPESSPSQQALTALRPEMVGVVHAPRTPSEHLAAQRRPAPDDAVAQMHSAAEEAESVDTMTHDATVTESDPNIVERVRFERTLLGVAAATLTIEKELRPSQATRQEPSTFQGVPASSRALAAISKTDVIAPNKDEQPLAGAYGLYGLRELPLLGRLSERQETWNAVRDSYLTKQPRVVLLEGAAGVGKSRLARSIMERGEQLGLLEGMHTWWSAQGSVDEGLRGLIENTLDCRGSTLPQATKRLEFWLSGIEGDHSFFTRDILALLHPPPGVELDAGLPLRAALELIERAALRRPVLLWLDDLQWSKGEGMALVQGLLERQLSACVIASIRADEPAPPGYETLGAHPHAHRVQINALDQEATKMLLRGMLDLDDALCSFLSERAEGNPLFMLQLLRQLVEADALARHDGKYQLAKGFDLSLVPESIDALWEKRVLVALPSAEERQLLWLLSLMRAKIAPLLLQSIKNTIGEELFHRALQGALSSGLCLLVDGALLWTHGLLRDYLLRNIPEQERPRLHALAAKALEPMSSSGEDVEHERARHLYAAGSLTEAADSMQKAAVWARGAGRFTEARARNEELIRWLKDHTPKADALRAFACADLALDELQRGTQQASEAWINAAQRAADRSQVPAALAHVSYRHGTLRVSQGDIEGALQHAKQAALVSRAAGLVKQEADSLITQSMFLRRQSKVLESRQISKEALRLYEQSNNPRGQAFALRELGYCALSERLSEEAAQHFERALNLFKNAGDAHGEASIHLSRGYLLHDQRDYPAASRHFTQYINLVERAGLLHHGILGRLGLIGSACAANVLKEADEQLSWVERRNPKEPIAKTGIAYYRAEISASLGWPTPHSYLTQAIATQKNTGVLNHYCAESCERTGARLSGDLRVAFLKEAARLWEELKRPQEAERVRGMLAHNSE